jgi:hypothetical protein
MPETRVRPAERELKVLKESNTTRRSSVDPVPNPHPTQYDFYRALQAITYKVV